MLHPKKLFVAVWLGGFVTTLLLGAHSEASLSSCISMFRACFMGLKVDGDNPKSSAKQEIDPLVANLSQYDNPADQLNAWLSDKVPLNNELEKLKELVTNYEVYQSDFGNNGSNRVPAMYQFLDKNKELANLMVDFVKLDKVTESDACSSNFDFLGRIFETIYKPALEMNKNPLASPELHVHLVFQRAAEKYLEKCFPDYVDLLNESLQELASFSEYLAEFASQFHNESCSSYTQNYSGDSPIIKSYQCDLERSAVEKGFERHLKGRDFLFTLKRISQLKKDVGTIRDDESNLFFKPRSTGYNWSPEDATKLKEIFDRELVQTCKHFKDHRLTKSILMTLFNLTRIQRLTDELLNSRRLVFSWLRKLVLCRRLVDQTDLALLFQEIVEQARSYN